MALKAIIEKNETDVQTSELEELSNCQPQALTKESRKLRAAPRKKNPIQSPDSDSSSSDSDAEDTLLNRTPQTHNDAGAQNPLLAQQCEFLSVRFLQIHFNGNGLAVLIDVVLYLSMSIDIELYRSVPKFRR